MSINKVLGAFVRPVVISSTKNNQSNNKGGVVSNPIQQKNVVDSSAALKSYFTAGQNVNFTGHYCDTSEFRVKDLEHIPCACCGKDMMTGSQISRFGHEVAGKTGEDLAKVLTEHLEYFRPDEKAIAHHLIKKTQQEPSETISKLVELSINEAGSIYKNGELNVLEQISKAAKKLMPNNEALRDLNKQSISIIKNGEHFNRTSYLQKLQKVTNYSHDNEPAGKLLDMAISLPLSLEGIEKFVRRYSEKTDVEIASNLAQRSIITAEHIFPKAKGGKNDTSNYMGECAECNNERGTTSLPIWMMQYPNMPRSSQRYIDAVTDKIVQGEMGAFYDDYPTDLEKTLTAESKGVIKLKVKNQEQIEAKREELGLDKVIDELNIEKKQGCVHSMKMRKLKGKVIGKIIPFNNGNGNNDDSSLKPLPKVAFRK